MTATPARHLQSRALDFKQTNLHDNLKSSGAVFTRVSCQSSEQNLVLPKLHIYN